MGGKDWTVEARRLLATAVGSNDNKAFSQASPTVIFQAPVTVLNLTMDSVRDSTSPESQRCTLIHRLEGALAGEGEKVVEEFRSELQRAFGTDSVAHLQNDQLASLATGFNTMLRFARLLSGAPQR